MTARAVAVEEIKNKRDQEEGEKEDGCGRARCKG
jgi:hypothetical protein